MDSISLFLSRLPSRIYNIMETIQFVLGNPFPSKEKLRSGCASEEEISTWSTRALSASVFIFYSPDSATTSFSNPGLQFILRAVSPLPLMDHLLHHHPFQMSVLPGQSNVHSLQLLLVCYSTVSVRLSLHTLIKSPKSWTGFLLLDQDEHTQFVFPSFTCSIIEFHCMQIGQPLKGDHQ